MVSGKPLSAVDQKALQTPYPHSQFHVGQVNTKIDVRPENAGPAAAHALKLLGRKKVKFAKTLSVAARAEAFDSRPKVKPPEVDPLTKKL